MGQNGVIASSSGLTEMDPPLMGMFPQAPECVLRLSPAAQSQGVWPSRPCPSPEPMVMVKGIFVIWTSPGMMDPS